MTLYDELIARGLIAQVTNEEEIKNMINNGKATFYIGFDCTADSLHVGHFMALCLMKRLQMAGNKPIALIGDGTTLIGDPSGRTDMRQMLTEETIKHNAECFKRQMERFIDFSDGKALMLYNSEWLKPLNYIELLREVGACFSVNNMLRAECYKQRMEKGLSFLEFNYMIMQSYDFYYMFPGQLRVHLRELHQGSLQPVCVCCGAGCCGQPLRCLQPAVHLRRLGPRQDPSADGHPDRDQAHPPRLRHHVCHL